MQYYMKNVQEFYDSIDVFLFPTIYEGYGMVASEALCRGIPVLTHDIPTVREATMDGAQYVPTSAYEDMEEWSAMLQIIERNYEKYAKKALATASRLKERQESESRDLIGFLESLK
jgi:glycosyltransferase involved in cell wall biosynthesis